ncbi:phoE Broad specificity phosphatase PhoE and related phosphatases [Candidatus Nanopelagicaceae bacterium]
MSTLIFLRHGHSAANAKDLLTGQLPGVGLSPQGKKQALGLVERIGKGRIDYLHISPIERCQLTVDPWLRSKNSSSLTRLEIVDGISEIDFGSWSGRKLSSLRREPLWKDVQKRPSQVTFPDGESFRKAQKRAVAAVEEIQSMRGEKMHLIVSHSDTIKLVIAHYLQMKLDAFQSLHVSPASFSILRTGKSGISIPVINSNQTLKELIG